ncbi:MAG: hypothetical protein GJ680_01020 [Alteromonadaceae bacterium]|nr:hypothetical protein [Alteromonadaceae bacterium]
MTEDLLPATYRTPKAKQTWFTIVTGITLTVTFLTALLLNFYQSLAQTKHEETQSYLHLNKEIVKVTIDEHMRAVELVADELTAKLVGVSGDYSAIQHQVNNIGSIYDGFIGIGAAFEPFAVSDSLRLFAPYSVHFESGYRSERIDAYYDYFNIQADGNCTGDSWYKCAKAQNGGWLPIQFDEISNAWVVPYTKAIEKDGQLLGYSLVNVALDEIASLISKVDTGDEGYAIIFNSELRETYHSLYPNSRIDSQIHFSDVFPKIDVNEAKQHGEHLYVVANELTGSKSYLDIAHIEYTDWLIALVIEREFFAHHELKNEVHSVASYVEQNHHILPLFCVLSVICWAVFISSMIKIGIHNRIWYSAIVVTATFFIGIVYVWVEQQVTDLDAIYGRTVVSNDADLKGFIKDYSKDSLKHHKPPPIFIPTGMAVQSVKMDSENNLYVSGYVWQRYLLSNDFDIEKGVVFPESRESIIKQVYENDSAEYKTIGWEFHVLLPEHFDYETYPFDKQLLGLRVWPKDYQAHVILTPDLMSYDSMNTSSKPGLEKDFEIAGWRVERSFFDYHFNDFNSNLGITDKANKTHVPELHFNIAITRNFIDPFVSYLFPVIIVLLMLYAVLLTNSKDESRIGLVGFNALEVLASASALFFVALLAHVELRSHIGANELIYLEYFFIVAYIMILIVSVNSILFSWGINIRLIQYQDNNIPKLLYWPVLGGLLFSFTLFAFW